MRRRKRTSSRRASPATCPTSAQLHDKLPIRIQMLRATLATAGCRTIDELHEKAVLEMQSPTALMDSQIHDIVPTQTDQQVL